MSKKTVDGKEVKNISLFDCVKCGNKHGMLWHDHIKNTDEPLNMCSDCINWIFLNINFNSIPANTVDDDMIKICRQKIETWLKNTDEQIIGEFNGNDEGLSTDSRVKSIEKSAITPSSTYPNLSDCDPAGIDDDMIKICRQKIET